MIRDLETEAARQGMTESALVRETLARRLGHTDARDQFGAVLTLVWALRAEVTALRSEVGSLRQRFPRPR